MKTNILSGGVVHTIPKDLRDLLISHSSLREVWEDITPLAAIVTGKQIGRAHV